MKTIVYQPVMRKLNFKHSEDMSSLITDTMELMVTEGSIVDPDELFNYMGDSEYHGWQPLNKCYCLEDNCIICAKWMAWNDVADTQIALLQEGFRPLDDYIEPGELCLVQTLFPDSIIISHGDLMGG